MLKKLGLSAAALAALLMFSAPVPADARVHFGISVGTPGYVYPAPPPYSYYPDPYNYAYPDYYYGHPYAYTTPYVAPYYYGFGWGGHERHEWREHEEHEHERGFRNRGFGEHGFGERGHGGHEHREGRRR